MLTELACKGAKAKDKTYMLRDDRGLYLRVDTKGRKYWILRQWRNGKEHAASLGPYPTLSLKDARIKRDSIKSEKFLPSSETRIFTEAVSEWLAVRMADKTPRYVQTIKFRLGKYVFPYIGDMEMPRIKPADILAVCRRVERMNKPETATRLRIIIGQIFRFAMAASWCDSDPTVALRGALQTYRSKHYSTIVEPEKIAALMRAIINYPYAAMRCALLFSIYTFARPGEIRHAEWAEIKGDTWDIPAEKMKMKRRHIVPLSKQVQKVLKELRPLTGKSIYLFPNPRNDGRCMSENGVRVALRSLGFEKEEITPHGFRAMFSTIANEQGWNRDVIERQLAHVEQNQVRGAYNHAEYLDERRRMMQWWSDYLDGLAAE